MWDGMDEPLESEGWPLIAASPLLIYRTAQYREKWTALIWIESATLSSTRL